MTAHIRSQDVHDPVENIRQWQSRQSESRPDDRIDEAVRDNEVAHLCADLLSLFKDVMRAVLERNHIPKAAQISLERSRSAMILWSDGCGITQGRSDEVLSKSRKLRRTVLKTLSHLGNILIERLIPSVDIWSEKIQDQCMRIRATIEEAATIVTEEAGKLSDASSSDASSVFSDDNLDEIAEDLKTDTLVLAGLDPLFKHPVFDLDCESRVEDYLETTWAPERLYADKIENRFPLADVVLASHLGKANYQRYLRCQADRDKHDRERASSLTRIDIENAGTVIASSKFHDSGIGTSLGPTASYAETMMSYSHEGGSIRIPPLPAEAKTGLRFPCAACGRVVLITNNSAWKRHIYLDLQPYMCLDMLCPHNSAAFDSREKWISHLALDHAMDPEWRSINCPLCRKETGNGKMAVTRHLSKHLEEISLSALPVDDGSNADSEISSEESASSPNISEMLSRSGEGSLTQKAKKQAKKEAEIGAEAERKKETEAAAHAAAAAKVRPEDATEAAQEAIEIVRKKLEEEATWHTVLEQKAKLKAAIAAREKLLKEAEADVLDRPAAKVGVENALKVTQEAIEKFENKQEKEAIWPKEPEQEAKHIAILVARLEEEFAAQEKLVKELKAEVAASFAKAAAEVRLDDVRKTAEETIEIVGKKLVEELKWRTELEQEAKLKAEIAAREKLEKATSFHADMAANPLPSVSSLAEPRPAEDILREPSDDQTDVDNVQDGDSHDDNEPRYCYCDGVAYGEMVACDAENCPREWFHLHCVGLKMAPKANVKWYCGDCEKRLDSVADRRRGGRAKSVGGESSDGGNADRRPGTHSTDEVSGGTPTLIADQHQPRDRDDIRSEIQALQRELEQRDQQQRDRSIVRAERLPTGELVLTEEEVEKVVEPRRGVRIEKDKKGMMSISVPKYSQ